MKKTMSQYLDKEFIIRSNNMVRKRIGKRIVKKISDTYKAKNDPVGDLKKAKAGIKPKSKPKTRPKTTTAKKIAVPTAATAATAAVKVPSAAKKAGAAALGLGSATGAATLINRKKTPEPKGKTFNEAFKEARSKGEGTKFTHNGKNYTAVTKDDLKKKGYDANELAAYNKRKGKKRGPLNRAGQKVKKVLLGKDKKFGGDKGAIDFIRKPKKKAGGGMMKYSDGGTVGSSSSSSRRGVGAAKRGFGKALK